MNGRLICWPHTPITDAVVRAALDARAAALPTEWRIHPDTLEQMVIEREANYIEERPFRLDRPDRLQWRHVLLGLPVVPDPSIRPGDVEGR